jgi:ATP/maltotriose-dependent transcriptional regulator MalT
VTDVAERQKERSQLEKANAYLEHQVRKRTQKLSGANAELKARQEQLVKSRKELTRMNRDLSEANRALTILSKNLGQNKSSSKREIALTISSKVLPIVDKLRVASSTQDDQTDLDTLALYLKELTAPLDKGEKLFTLLSAMEMKVAIKIKNGMTTSQIAKELFISEGTVKSHRRNIRRKLGLKNARINLRNYLRLKSRKIVS